MNSLYEKSNQTILKIAAGILLLTIVCHAITGQLDSLTSNLLFSMPKGPFR